MSEKPAVDDVHCAGCLVKERRIAQLEADNEALREYVPEHVKREWEHYRALLEASK